MTGSSTCVVGAGPAGIVTATTLLDDGFDVTVYEKYDEIGGTWSSHRRYVDLHHQLDKGIFEFSDMPNDAAYESAQSIQAYLEEYAERFGVAERLHLETEVGGIEREADGWAVEIGRPDGTTERNQFDYVAICCGFHHIPKVPDVPGIDTFDGPVRHSSEVNDERLIEDGRVVVVGAGKSAIDLATKAGERGSDVTLVFREANWLFPKKIFGGLLPHRFIFYSRFGESLLPNYYNDDCVRLIDRLPRAFKDGMWSVIEKDLLLSGGLWGVDDDMIPDRELPHDIVHTGILPESFSGLIKAGRITPRQTTIERVDETGVQLAEGDVVDADAIVFATGFEKEIPFLNGFDLKTDDGRFALYRAIVPPGVEDLGVVGLRQSFNNILTMEVSAHWLSAYFQEDLVEMPTAEEMRETMQRRLEWQERVMPGTRGYHYGPYDLHAVDELLMDMGVQPRRSANPVAEYLLPGAKARRYADLTAEREQAAAAPSPPAGGASAKGTITSLLGLFGR